MDTHVLEPHEDLQRLQLSRQQLQAPGDESQNAEDIFWRAREGMGQDKAQFNVEMPLGGCASPWTAKYWPHKPRFFNRVHTGFEWNKYNQIHYDVDNPLPKIVQGYKFNIFYPNLLHKRSTPEYFLEGCVDNSDFAIVCFHAGPPYQDIAFKIVRREWEYSHRLGFRGHFANGIFQLWFHFKPLTPVGVGCPPLPGRLLDSSSEARPSGLRGLFQKPWGSVDCRLPSAHRCGQLKDEAKPVIGSSREKEGGLRDLEKGQRDSEG